MLIKGAKKYSERGSLKNLIQPEDPYQLLEKASAAEIRMKTIIDHAYLTKNKDMLDSLGFITTDHISDKNAMPLNIHHLRQIVADLKSKSTNDINQLAQIFSTFISDELSVEVKDYLNKKYARIKTASPNKAPIFWRARK